MQLIDLLLITFIFLIESIRQTHVKVFIQILTQILINNIFRSNNDLYVVINTRNKNRFFRKLISRLSSIVGRFSCHY